MTVDTSRHPVPPGSALQPALLRLVELVEEENAVLRENRITSHAIFTNRKNQLLREVMAAQRSEDLAKAAEACRGELVRLSSALRVNASLLKLHISAVGQVSDIIIGSLRQADSDGTYSRQRPSGG